MKTLLKNSVSLVSSIATCCTLFSLLSETTLAQSIPPMEVRAALENIVVDTEFGLLTYYEGSASDVLNYSSEITDTGWIGTLSGIYAGKPLNIDYVGNTGNLSSMSWTGSGTWGLENWSSSGDASYEELALMTIAPSALPLEGVLDLENMQVGLSVSGTIGVGSITVSLLKDLDDMELIASIAASALDVPVLGSALEKELSFTLSQKDFTYKSQEEFRVLFGILSKNYIVNSGSLFYTDNDNGGGGGGNQIPGFNPNSGGVTMNEMDVQALPVPVPEPTSTLSLLAFGTLGAASTLKRKLKPSKKDETKVS